MMVKGLMLTSVTNMLFIYIFTVYKVIVYGDDYQESLIEQSMNGVARIVIGLPLFLMMRAIFSDMDFRFVAMFTAYMSCIITFIFKHASKMLDNIRTKVV